MKRIVFAIAAATFGTIVALLLGEAVLRVSGVWIGRHSDTMFSVIEHDAKLGWKMTPGFERKVDFVDVEGIAVRSNSDGFWDDEFTSDDARGVCRVAFLGDSFTWGMGVEQGERFTDLLEYAGVNALNFGMPGFGTDQSLLTWQHEASRFSPDVVVMTVYKNDYYDNVHEIRYGRPKPYFVVRGDEIALQNVPVTRATFWDHGIYNRIAEPYAGLYNEPLQLRSRPLHWLVKHSDLVRLAYRVSQAGVVSRRLEEQLDDGAGSHERTAENQASTQPPHALTHRLAGGTEHAEKAVFVNLTETSLSSPSTPSARDASERGLERLLLLALRDRTDAAGTALIVVFAGPAHPGAAADMEALRDAGLPVIDASTEALLSRLAPDTPVYFPYNQHWTQAAHRVVADLLTEAVAASCASSTERM